MQKGLWAAGRVIVLALQPASSLSNVWDVWGIIQIAAFGIAALSFQEAFVLYWPYAGMVLLFVAAWKIQMQFRSRKEIESALDHLNGLRNEGVRLRNRLQETSDPAGISHLNELLSAWKQRCVEGVSKLSKVEAATFSILDRFPDSGLEAVSGADLKAIDMYSAWLDRLLAIMASGRPGNCPDSGSGLSPPMATSE